MGQMLGEAKTRACALVLVAALYGEVAVGEPGIPAAASSSAAEPVPQPATAETQPPTEAPPASAASSAPTPAPTAPPTPVPAPPSVAIAAVPAIPLPEPPRVGAAWIHISSNYLGTWLEGRSRIDDEEWRGLCAAPCDRSVVVDGLDVRVTAPKMTPSNSFIIEPGVGAAKLRVSGGSTNARTFGLVGLGGGLPVTFAGVTLFGVGSIHSDAGERTAGIVTLSIGAAAVLAALPLLLSGATSVTNAEGRHVAETTGRARAF